MKKNIILSVWAFVLIIFETVICRYIGIGGVYPEIVFVFVICAAVLDDNLIRVTVLSCLCGLIIDCLGGAPVGVNLFACGICAVISNFVTEKFFMSNIFVMLVCVVICTLLTRFIIFTMGFAVFGNASLAQIFIPLVLKYVLYDTAVSVIIYALLKKTVYIKAAPHSFKRSIGTNRTNV